MNLYIHSVKVFLVQIFFNIILGNAYTMLNRIYLFLPFYRFFIEYVCVLYNIVYMKNVPKKDSSEILLLSITKIFYT